MKRIYEFFEDLDKRRDLAFQIGKEVIKLATKSIINTFSENFEEAKEYISSAREKLREFESLFDKELLKLLGDFYTTVKQEVVEAIQFLNIMEKKRIESYEKFEGFGEIEWILGTLDAIGELSRKMYDLLINGKKEEFMEYLTLMEGFYNEILPLSIYKFVSNLRYRIDLTRKKIEEFKKILVSL